MTDKELEGLRLREMWECCECFRCCTIKLNVHKSDADPITMRGCPVSGIAAWKRVKEGDD